jgi:hypothetical protein
LIEQSYQDVDASKIGKFNVLLYDASLDYNEIYGALPHFLPCLDNVFVYIVDDINWRYIHKAAKSSIADQNLTILYEKEIFLTADDTHTPMELATASWWNGLYVAVLKKNN